MKRNCNLELRLVPPSLPFNASENGSPSQFMLESVKDICPTKHQLTIFYNGKTAVCDVTEFQARSIISSASREMDHSSFSPTTPLIQPQTPSPSGLSMKRSLQRFLQKRNNRAQAASPYHLHH